VKLADTQGSKPQENLCQNEDHKMVCCT